MRMAIIKSSDLKDSLSPSFYIPPSDNEIRQAKIAGWTCGARGTKQPRNDWTRHSSTVIRDAFWAAHAQGWFARNDFLGTLEVEDY